MAKSKKSPNKKLTIISLVCALLVVVGGSILFVGAVSGWFDSTKITLDPEYYGEGAKFMEINSDEYKGLIEAQKSFIVFVDQNGCDTADRLREYVTKYMTEHGILVYRMMFSEVKKSSLHDYVKYYPSVALIGKGKVKGYLRADSDEDSGKYNDYSLFTDWLNQHL